MSSSDPPTLLYSAPPSTPGALAIRHVSVILATFFALAGVLGALDLSLNVLLRLSARDWINAFAVNRSPNGLPRAMQLVGAVLAIIVGVQFLRGRYPRRASVVIAVCLLAGAQLTLGYEMIRLIAEGPELLRWQAVDAITWQAQMTIAQILIPLISLVWFTRPAVKRLYATMPPQG